MIFFRNADAIEQLQEWDLKRVIKQSIDLVTQGEEYDPEVYGQFVLVEPGDLVADIEQATGCQIMHDQFNDVTYGDPAFIPSFEWLVEHIPCYEAVFILSDDGYGIDLLIPKTDGIDGNLLKMCQQYAVPA